MLVKSERTGTPIEVPWLDNYYSESDLTHFDNCARQYYHRHQMTISRTVSHRVWRWLGYQLAHMADGSTAHAETARQWILRLRHQFVTTFGPELQDELCALLEFIRPLPDAVRVPGLLHAWELRRDIGLPYSENAAAVLLGRARFLSKAWLVLRRELNAARALNDEANYYRLAGTVNAAKGSYSSGDQYFERGYHAAHAAEKILVGRCLKQQYDPTLVWEILFQVVFTKLRLAAAWHRIDLLEGADVQLAALGRETDNPADRLDELRGHILCNCIRAPLSNHKVAMLNETESLYDEAEKIRTASLSNQPHTRGSLRIRAALLYNLQQDRTRRDQAVTECLDPLQSPSQMFQPAYLKHFLRENVPVTTLSSPWFSMRTSRFYSIDALVEFRD